MSDEDSWGFDSEIPDGQASSTGPVPTLGVGDRFGEAFKLLEELGRGGFGIVFRAREEASGRELALKILTRRLSDRQRQRFQREGELTAALRHPGIVRIHSAGEVDGVPYLAYELLPGKSLKDALPELGREARIQLVVDAARAVGHAHAQGVVHRDLKPDNLLLDAEGKVRVADFGLAWSQGVDRLTQSGAMVGTPSHMAPEQWDTNEGEVTPATDVWALGAILYHCLTDEAPFQATTLVAMGAAVVAGRPRGLRAIDDTISAALEAVCLKALSRHAADRYPDAAALAADLENARVGASVDASSPSWARAATSLRRSWHLGLALVVVLALAVGASVIGLRSRPPGQVELRQWMAEARAGEAAALEEGLPRVVDVPPALRAEAHLLLAGRDRGAAALAHAEAALALQPSGPAEWVRGRALAELERWEEAAAAWRAATELGAPPAAWLDLAKVELRLNRARAAVAACRRFLKDSGPKPQPEARLLLFRALLASSAPEEAEAALASLGPGFDRARRRLLYVELARAKGEDVEPLLRKGVDTFPDRPAMRRALVECLVQRSELRSARAAVGDWVRANGGREAESVRRALATLFTIPLRLTGLPRAWHTPVAAWLIREAERELAFRARAADSACEPLRGAPPVATREVRARAALQAALDLKSGPDQVARAHRGLARLHPPGARARVEHLRRAAARLPDDPLTLRLRAADALANEQPGEAVQLVAGQGHRIAQELRGRAYLALGRLDEAVAELDRASSSRRRIEVCRLLARALARAGRVDEQKRVEERIRRLSGSKRKEARAQNEHARTLRKSKRIRREDLIAAYQLACDLDPGFVDPQLAIAKLEFVGGDSQAGGIANVMREIERSPRLFAEFQRSLLAISEGFAGRTGIQEAMKLGFDRRQPSHQRAWLVLATSAIEFERRADLLSAALKQADALLARDPAEITTRVMRGFLHLRAGRLARADRDLAVAASAAPEVSSTAFYRALLAARQGRPVSVVRALLHEARKKKYEVWDANNWTPDDYPEMSNLRDLADLDKFGK